jgi:PAS domain S-box-containing protein
MRYRRLFETSHDGILILDASSGRILDANPFMTNLLGLSHQELLGKELWQVGLLLDAERSRVTSGVLREPGFIRHEELFLQSASHPEGIDVEVVSNKYQEDGDQVIQYHIRDITERKRADLNAALYVDELAAADRHRYEFLAMLSHELRNALAPVQNALLILRLAQESDSPVRDKARTLIERQVGHLSHLVDDLQEISSVDSGRMRLQPGLVDLREVVQRSVDAVMSAYAHRKHQVSVTLPAEPIWLDADAIRLEQVVVNLLSNAAIYTQDGGCIAVMADRAQDHAELRVADSGIGIAPEMLPRVFDLFVRAEAARDHSRKGLGIGLNIVKRIVDLHGGSVVARSEGPGTGSEFVVSLPLVSCAA